MLKKQDIDSIVGEVAAAHLAAANVSSVSSESIVDGEGKDALLVTIVLQPEAVASISGDATLDTLVQIQNRLNKAGEERFAFVEFATTAEVDEIGDSQP